MRTFILLTLACAVAVASPAFAQSPKNDEVLDVDTIIHKMKTALEPPRSSLRRIDLITHTPAGVTEEGANAKDVVVELKARQARKKLADGNAVLTVMLDPPGVRGAAYLVRENKGDHQWLYLPAIRRVRKINGIDALQPFLGTDFTYADMGFVDLRDSKFNLLGQEKIDGTQTFKVEEVPSSQWYFSRIITWVDMKTMLFVGRDYYDMANQLWKVEQVKDTSVIDGTPTIMLVNMEDRPAGTRTELRVSEVHYDAKIPDELFDPNRLSKAIDSPVWKQK